MNKIYVFKLGNNYGGGMNFILAHSHKEAQELANTDADTPSAEWEYVGTLKQFEKIVKRQKKYNHYYFE